MKLLRVIGVKVRVTVTKPVSFNSQAAMGDDARIEKGSWNKKKLEYPESMDKPRYEIRQRHPLEISWT